MKYKWLHLSDLHSISGIKTEIMRLALLSEIYEIKPFSFILITGDISEKNTGYLDSKDLILSIASKSGLSNKQIFIVPGNHDINRDKPDNRNTKCRNLWKHNDLITSDSIIEELAKGQEDFFASYKDILEKEYPACSLHFYVKYDDNLAILHINTSWMCCDSDNESGKLHLGIKKLSNLFKNNHELMNTPIKIAIGHHKLEDFNVTVRNNFKTLLKEYDIDLYLGGHCHESSVVYDPIINVEFCSCRQARAEDLNYPAGFIVGNIDTETDQSYFEFYSWDTILSKWTYDYTVNLAKHGKYYLNHSKYKKSCSRSVMVDLKFIGNKLETEMVSKKYNNLAFSEVYSTSLVNINPQSLEMWYRCFGDVYNLFNQVVSSSKQDIHVFPLAQIPLLIYFGFLMQNNSSNISIYQYCEKASVWVYDESSDDIEIQEQYILNNNRILALSVSISGIVQERDISNSINADYDLFNVAVKSPQISKCNYKKDIEKVKNAVKSGLDQLHSNYDELHLFLAAPAGLCVEIGRILRKDLYPDTFVYQYNRRKKLRYSRIANLMKLDYGC